MNPILTHHSKMSKDFSPTISSFTKILSSSPSSLLSITMVVFAAFCLFTSSPSLSLVSASNTHQMTSQQQQVYHTLGSLHSLEDLSHRDYEVIVNILNNITFEQFLLGLSTDIPVVKQVTLQMLINIIEFNSPFPHQPHKEHHFTQILEHLSSFFIQFYKKNPINYDPHSPPVTDTTFTHRETELISIVQPIVNVATLDSNSPLRHIAIECLKKIISHYPGTTPTTLRLLQYISGQDVYIAGVLYQGSRYTGHDQYINQQFLSKIARLHLSSIWHDDYETLRKLSISILDLQNGNVNDDNNNDDDDNNNNDDNGDGGINNNNTIHHRHSTLSFTSNHNRMNTMGNISQNSNIHQHDDDNTLTKKRAQTIYSALQFTDNTLDKVLTDINLIGTTSEDNSILYECSFALAESKISNQHINTLYSLVISPDYNASYYALIGIKKIALLSAIPGTIYITPATSSTVNGTVKDNNGHNNIQDTETSNNVKKYVQAVSQAELTALINPSHGQLAIKILKHAASKHPNYHLQQFASLAFDDTIAEVKAQLQHWYSMIASKGLLIYQENDNTTASMNDLKFKQKYSSLRSSFSRGRLVERYQQWQNQQQGKKTNIDGNNDRGRDVDGVSSVQQILFIAKSKGIKSLHRNNTNNHNGDNNNNHDLKNNKKNNDKLNDKKIEKYNQSVKNDDISIKVDVKMTNDNANNNNNNHIQQNAPSIHIGNGGGSSNGGGINIPHNNNNAGNIHNTNPTQDQLAQ